MYLHGQLIGKCVTNILEDLTTTKRSIFPFMHFWMSFPYIITQCITLLYRSTSPSMKMTCTSILWLCMSKRLQQS